MPAGSKRKAPPLRDAHTASPRPPRDPADDCETPAVAYAHLAPLLTKLAQRLKKPVADLRVWDPYHCAGGVKSRLGALGFTRVVNDPELDFYDVVDGAAPPPPHDVLVTNPPFSGNHARALFQYLRSKDGEKGDATPFAVLAPEYVHRKAWYAPRGGVFYMVPESRYEFVAAGGGRSENTDVPCRHWRRERRCPRGETCPFVHEGPGIDPGAEHTAEEARRAGIQVPRIEGKAGDDGKVVSPFACYWHCHFGAFNRSVVAAWRQKHGKRKGGGIRMVESAVGLPPPPDKSAKRAKG